MPNLVTESSRVQAACPEQTSTQSVQLATSQAPTDSARLNKLPYQATHKAELIHLQEDIDALLRQLQTLKQQRQASGEPMPESSTTEMPVLV